MLPREWTSVENRGCVSWSLVLAADVGKTRDLHDLSLLSSPLYATSREGWGRPFISRGSNHRTERQVFVLPRFLYYHEGATLGYSTSRLSTVQSLNVQTDWQKDRQQTSKAQNRVILIQLQLHYITYAVNSRTHKSYRWALNFELSELLTNHKTSLRYHNSKRPKPPFQKWWFTEFYIRRRTRIPKF